QRPGHSENPYEDCRHIPTEHNDPAGDPPEPGGWFLVLCSPDGKDPLSHGPVWIADDDTPSVSPEQLAQTARERLRLPALHI
ncbi:hypothetical protein K7G98_42330, partial [Saccharothrix sp. MB29]|nr:hypothetical protein [Saccharothrix sp. MB29]